MPCIVTVLNVETKWCYMDFVMDINKSKRRHKFIEGNLDIFTQFEVGMKKLHLLVPQGWLAKCAAHNITALQNYSCA
jgi:hypothetical protein